MSQYVSTRMHIKFCESNFYTAVRFYRKGHCVVGEWSFYVYGFRLCLKFVYLSVYVCMVVFVCTVCATLSYVFWCWLCESEKKKVRQHKKDFPFPCPNTINDMEILREEISNNIYGIHIKKGPGIQMFSFYEAFLYISYYNVT